MVVRRRLGVEGGLRHHPTWWLDGRPEPPSGGSPSSSRWIPTSRRPHLLVRGRRLRPRARRPPSNRESGRRRRPGTRTPGGRSAYPWGDQPPVAGPPREPRQPGRRSAAGRLISSRRLALRRGGMIGDVWEWTATEFAGYPGFTPIHTASTRSRSSVPGYRVLRGGSWASRPRVASHVPQLGPPPSAARSSPGWPRPGPLRR